MQNQEGSALLERASERTEDRNILDIPTPQVRNKSPMDNVNAIFGVIGRCSEKLPI
jgi:hypothetical protein